MSVEAATTPLSVLTGAHVRPRTMRCLQGVLAMTAAVDAVVLGVAVALAWDLRQLFDVWFVEPLATSNPAHDAMPYLVLGWLVMLAAQGAYSSVHLATGSEGFRVVVLASLLMAGLAGLVCYLLALPLSRGFLLLVFVIGTPALLTERSVVRYCVHLARARGLLLHRVVAVGDAVATNELSEVLEREQHVGFRIVGACLPEGSETELDRFTVPLLGTVAELREVCERVGADTVLVARGGHPTPRHLRRIAWALEGSRINLVVVPSLTEVSVPRVSMRPVAGLPLLHVQQPRSAEAGGVAKRAFDLVGALVMLLVLAPLMLSVAAAVRLGDGGPVFYRQARVGRGGRTFGCLKFRSMVVDADRFEQGLRQQAGHLGALWKMDSDPRMTRVGAFIRRFSIDELPQLLNVVRGEMSLVGPRPQQAWEVETYTDWEGRRLRVRPGMTGLWQVSGRSQLSFDEAIRLDLYYVDNWSMTADLVIIARTVRAVLSASGAS